jgi:hypothetical protein
VQSFSDVGYAYQFDGGNGYADCDYHVHHDYRNL